MASVLVTGGAGFIGSHLVEALVARGDRVRVLDDFSTGRREHLDAVADRIEIVAGSVEDAETCAAAARGCAGAFHLAAIPSVPRSVADPAETHRVTCTGTVNVLLAAKAAGIRRVVYASSSAVYGEGGAAPREESMPLEPLSPYAAAKLAGEHYCAVAARVLGVETVSLRYFNVFGPRQDPGSEYSAVVPRFISRMAAGRMPIVYGDGLQTRDFVYIGDVVRANLLAMDREPCPVPAAINIAGGGAISLLKLIELINVVLGTSLAPDFQPARAGDVRASLASISRASTTLGWTPATPLADGLSATVRHFRR